MLTEASPGVATSERARSALRGGPSLRLLRPALAHGVAMVAAIVMVVPIYLVVVNALKSPAQASSMGMDLPTSLHFENFTAVIDEGKLAISFFNSMLYAVGASVVATLVAAMAAFVLSRNRTSMNRAVYLFLIMGIALPVNFFTLTKVMEVAHLINTRPGIIILDAALQVPFAVFLIYGFVESIPRELDEAATIDGCSPLRLFFYVIVPLLKPVLVTTFILSFLNVWNDFMMPLYYLNSSDNWPMTLAVYNFFGQYQQNWNLVSADILLTIIPVVVIYLAGQRFIISGLTSGSVKG